MALLPNYLRRTTAILRMPDAIKQGMSASSFLRKIQFTTGGYQKKKFLADWRSVAGLEKKKDAFKYVRKDRRPPMSAIADVEWDTDSEYMFKMRCWVRTAPGEPMTERFVNIPSDSLLTQKEMEEEVFERWAAWEKYQGEELVRVQAVSGWHNVLVMDVEA